MKKYIIFGISFFIFATLLVMSLSVQKPEIETLNVENIAMQEEYVVLSVGDTAVLLASVYPFNANNQTVLWSSSDNGVASVENGIVTAHKTGNVQITATTAEGGYRDYCYVDVIW
ncbi:MAG: hypothetical protein CVV59_01630 [Tenericutes bacterium HGW-Tenericutes-4]|jgi:uncharacterized protein YjdB|nr:MAG: hypothetical protein CVV59_01630 [Tenericutes bacterium HGW-Tenericutes-4]